MRPESVSLTRSVSLNRREWLQFAALTAAAPIWSRAGFGFAAEDAARDDEWSSFRNGPQLTGIAAAPLPESLTPLWTLATPDGVAATAAIRAGRVYVAELSGMLRCLERGTGKEIWAYRSELKPSKTSFAPGFKASPTLTPDVIFLGDEDGVFHAVDLAMGQRRWTFETGGEIISSATVVEDAVLFGSYDNTLYCLDRQTGEKRWEVVTDGYVHCTPAVVEGKTFIAGCDEHLRAIDIATGEVTLDMPIGTYLIASPATEAGLLYFGTYASTVVAIDPRRGETVWTYKNDRDFPFQSSAAVSAEVVVVGGRDKRVHALNRATGERRWLFETRSRVDSSPVIAGDRVYVGSSDRFLYVLDVATGREVARHSVGQPVTASPAVAEGVLVIGGEGNNGQVVCFGAA